MPPIPGMMHWHSLVARHAKSLRQAFERASKALEAQLSGQSRTVLEPIPVRNTPKQPLHPLARIRQGQNRWYSTARRSLSNSVRHFASSTSGHAVKHDRASFPTSRIASVISRSSGRAPFASTLRPNLTGGTLGRTAGGYTLGGSGRIGGARYFSHGPASQAQVVQNVSQGIRAFFISGQKAQFDGTSPHSGEKRFRTVTALQEQTGRRMRSLPNATPGSWIEFHVNPSITALTPLKAALNSRASFEADHLNTDGLLDLLSVDFSRALKDLAAVLNDLNRLTALGDLPITHENGQLRVHFPGCDASTVEKLCAELGVQRGTVVQDAAFDSFAGTEIALLFPFAPGEPPAYDEESDNSGAEFYEKPSRRTGYRRPVIGLDDMRSRSESAAYSTHSESGFEDMLADDDAWISSPSAFQSVRSGSPEASVRDSPLEYQGFEGIYRFIEELDAVRR